MSANRSDGSVRKKEVQGARGPPPPPPQYTDDDFLEPTSTNKLLLTNTIEEKMDVYVTRPDQ